MSLFARNRFPIRPGTAWRGLRPLVETDSLAPGARSGCERARFRKGDNGFTLLELLVVIAVVATLSGIVFGAGRHAAESGRDARARAELTALSAALESYRLVHGDYPRTNLPTRLLQSLIGRRGPDGQPLNARCLIDARRFTTNGGLDPFTNDTAELLDPWGQAYRYAYKSEASWNNPAYVLYSAGADGNDSATLQPGGFPNSSARGNADNLWASQ